MPTFDVSIHDLAGDLIPDTNSPHRAAVANGVGRGSCRWRSVVRRTVSLSADEIMGNAIARSARRAGRSTRNAKGCLMNRADPLVGAVVSQKKQTTGGAADPFEGRCEQTTASGMRLASPVRLTLASRLGHDIDGAWWPRTPLISRELPQLVSVLVARLGPIVDINVNWSALQSQPDLNLHCWRGIHQHVMAVNGRDARANLLIVPHRTATALAVLVLRQAAGLPIYAAHRDSRAFQTADSIVRLARGESV
jgi:hypothetical protein